MIFIHKKTDPKGLTTLFCGQSEEKLHYPWQAEIGGIILDRQRTTKKRF